ncbi:hypothetical protein TARUN_5705 [Trichoderma arundinaceum]|uniref:Uncharacterized protein n=1 Tax=Trichoderma arundinaceum TaxID=490622 RepID=A0A395NKW1_TRIAR|nr:hypothetical protein TARUN_5705 [Trichoderma arundinaceum]
MSILQPEDKRALVNQGLLLLDTPKDTQRIHKRRLTRNSNVEYSHLPLNSEPDMFVTIPEELVSLATIQYLGYGEESATHIWNRWIASAPGYYVPESDPAFGTPFIDAIIGYSDRRYDIDTCDEDDEKWHECMNRCGIDRDTQNAIMNPAFKRIRLTESCLFWIRDTIELRYLALLEVQKASHERSRAIEGAS